MLKRLPHPFLTTAAAVGCFTLVAAHAEVGADATAAVEAMSAKLAAAKTLKITGTRSVDKELLGASAIKEAISFEMNFARPNQIHATTRDESGTRHLLYDGKTITLSEKEQKIYASAALEAADATALASALSQKFGFYPPIAEFLAANPAEVLLSNVTQGSATAEGDNQKLSFVQDGIEWDIWVGKDHLPVRLAIRFTDEEGKAPGIDIQFSAWELGADLSGTSFTFAAAEDFTKIDMVPISED